MWLKARQLYAHASQPSGVKWVDALRASVRPIITYAFFILFATVKTAALFKLLDQGVGITDGLIAVWDGENAGVICRCHVILVRATRLGQVPLKPLKKMSHA